MQTHADGNKMPHDIA